MEKSQKLIAGGVGIIGGLEKISKINSQGGLEKFNFFKLSFLKWKLLQISLESLNLSWVHRILLCSFCLAWNLLPELINGGGVGIRMSWVEDFLKINKRGGGRLSDTSYKNSYHSEKRNVIYKKRSVHTTKSLWPIFKSTIQDKTHETLSFLEKILS